MKHTYWIKYPRNFANEYNLIVASSKDEELTLICKGFVRVSYKRMRELCSQEKDRRKTDPAFSGYAPTSPMPFKVFIKYKEEGII